MVCLPQVAKLSNEGVNQVKDLEKELDVVLIAYKPMEFAKLSDDQVKEIQGVEKDIKATVIAYRRAKTDRTISEIKNWVSI
jgi:hypothetical protein